MRGEILTLQEKLNLPEKLPEDWSEKVVKDGLGHLRERGEAKQLALRLQKGSS